ncbi:viral A-type inclusion protein, partial [Reticulomyxa filosa]
MNQDFNQQLLSINERYQEKIDTAHSKAQEQYNSQMSKFESEYSNFFAYMCKTKDLAKIRGIAKELSIKKMDDFFPVNNSNLNASFSKEDFDNGINALTKQIPDKASYCSLLGNKFKDLDNDVNSLHSMYKTKLSKAVESKKKKKRKNNEERPGNNDSIHKMRESQEDQQEIKYRPDCHDYLKIELITKFGQMYVRYKQIFLDSNPIKFVSSQEEELKKEYSSDLSRRELELNKEFLKRLDEKMNNNNPLSCVIEKCHNNELKGSIETRLKPIQHLGFVFGDFNIQGSKSDHLELKQVVQKNNEFDIRGNEELIFTYGLANNEIVLVVSIDGNISDFLPVDEKKYSDDNKQDVWSEQYNQNCTTRIFLSSRQTLNKNKKATEELRGKMTLAALSEQKHLMVLYERARQLIHLYKWNERIADSLQKLKNKIIDLSVYTLPKGFYVTGMCFNNKDDNLYILDNKNTIRCITLDAGLFNHERKIICKEQYSKVMMTLEGGYIVGIKPYEQKQKGQNKQVSLSQVPMQSEHDNDVVTEGNMQTSGEIHSDNKEPGSTNVDTKEGAAISTTDITTIPPVRHIPTALIQCDFYVLDDSKELVRSLVLPKEFISNGINDIQFKLVLQKQIYVVFLDDQFVFHCLPLQMSLKKSQLHIKLTSMNGNLTTSDDRKFRIKKPNKFGSKPEFYSQPKLALHLSVLLDANENKSSSSSSWISRERIAQASELVLHTCDK